jgi:hypothetical protein
MNELTEIEQATVFTALLQEVAREEAPRLFAIVEEYGNGEEDDLRVAGYGLAYEDRVEVNSVEGDFHLNSQSPEHARTLFEISSRSAGARRVHAVWLDETRSTQQDRGGDLRRRGEGAKR